MQTATVGTLKNGKPIDATVISYGLHYITGIDKPYFNITATVYRRGCWESGGCQHGLVLQARPDLKPLVDLHLSDVNGVPMHAEANGWYWLAGAAGGLGERYHGGNHRYGKKPAECQAILASHLRITPGEAAALVQSALASDPATARKQFAQYVEAQRPRWKAEADAAIKQFNLTVTEQSA